jgi:hypothetical protein
VRWLAGFGRLDYVASSGAAGSPTCDRWRQEVAERFANHFAKHPVWIVSNASVWKVTANAGSARFESHGLRKHLLGAKKTHAANLDLERSRDGSEQKDCACCGGAQAIRQKPPPSRIRPFRDSRLIPRTSGYCTFPIRWCAYPHHDVRFAWSLAPSLATPSMSLCVGCPSRSWVQTMTASFPSK